MTLYSRLMAAVQCKPKYVVTIGNYPEEHSYNNLAKFVSRVNMEIPFSVIPPARSTTNIRGNDLMNSASTHLEVFRVTF